jgi:hypothetical protein
LKWVLGEMSKESNIDGIKSLRELGIDVNVNYDEVGH